MKESKTVEISRSEIAEIARAVIRAKYNLPPTSEIAMQFKWSTDPVDKTKRIVESIEAVITTTDVPLGLLKGVEIGDRKIDFNL